LHALARLPFLLFKSSQLVQVLGRYDCSYRDPALLNHNTSFLAAHSIHDLAKLLPSSGYVHSLVRRILLAHLVASFQYALFVLAYSYGAGSPASGWARMRVIVRMLAMPRWPRRSKGTTSWAIPWLSSNSPSRE